MIIKKTFKNSIFAILSYSSIGIFTFVLRKVFLLHLKDIFLGYEGLFANIIEVISILSLGIDIIIYYRIEQAFGINDKKSAGELISFLKKFYLYNFLLVTFLALSILLICIKKGFFSSEILIIFSLMLISYYLQVFISIHRMLLIISQEDYIYIMVDFFGQLLSLGIRFFVLLVFNNYILYLFGSLIIVLLELIILKIIINKKFSELMKFKIEKNILVFAQKKGILFDIKNNIIQKTSLVIYGATDNILIAFFFGVGQVALLSNYYMIAGMFNNAMTKLFDPFQSAIGKIVNSNNGNKDSYFNAFNCLGFAIANISVFFSLVLFNDIISFIYGNKYSVSIIFVLFFSLNQYVTWNHKFLAYYRNLFGKYELDKYFILIGAFLNIFLSIVFTRLFGLPGIIIGTFVGHLSFWIGRVFVIFKMYIYNGRLIYVKNQIIYFSLVLLETWLLIFVSSQPNYNILFYIIKLFVCSLICVATILLGYLFTNSFKYVLWAIKGLKFIELKKFRN